MQGNHRVDDPSWEPSCRGTIMQACRGAIVHGSNRAGEPSCRWSRHAGGTIMQVERRALEHLGRRGWREGEGGGNDAREARDYRLGHGSDDPPRTGIASLHIYKPSVEPTLPAYPCCGSDQVLARGKQPSVQGGGETSPLLSTDLAKLVQLSDVAHAHRVRSKYQCTPDQRSQRSGVAASALLVAAAATIIRGNSCHEEDPCPVTAAERVPSTAVSFKDGMGSPRSRKTVDFPHVPFGGDGGSGHSSSDQSTRTSGTFQLAGRMPREAAQLILNYENTRRCNMYC